MKRKNHKTSLRKLVDVSVRDDDRSTARLSRLLHATSVANTSSDSFVTLSSSVLFFLASNVTAPFEAKTWPGLVNRAEEDFSGRHLFFRMRVDSRLVGLLFV